MELRDRLQDKTKVETEEDQSREKLDATSNKRLLMRDSGPMEQTARAKT